jgi:hypothetical protein
MGCLGRNHLQRNWLDERKTLHHLILQSLRSFVDLDKTRNVKFMPNLSDHLDLSPGISSWLLKVLFRALNAVDDFAKP